MSESISSESQRLEQDAIIVLFQIDATQVNEGILRFTNEAAEGGHLVFDGDEYVVLPIHAEGFEWTGQGKLPRPTLSVSALSLSFLSLLIDADDLIGLPIQRKRTYRKHLDDGSDPDPEALFPIDYYVFEQKTRQTATTLEFQLSVQMDQQGRKVPNRQVLRDACTQRYRRWNGDQFDYSKATCPYAGSQSYDVNGNPVDPADDRCGKRLRDCKLRFGDNANLPTWQFPGVGQAGR